MSSHVEYRGFAVSYDKSVRELIFPISVLPLLSADKAFPVVPVKVRALWDTGATVTCIKPALFDRLKLRLFDATGQTMLAGVGGKKPANPTLVSLLLTPTMKIEFCRVYVVDFPGDADVLIGMDIMQMGDFVVCNADNKTSFSFAIPPFPEKINLADKVNAANKSSIA